MAELFGFSIQRASKDVGPREKTFTDPTPDDGAIEIAGGGFFSSVSSTDEKNPPPAISIAPSSGVGSVKVFSRGPKSLCAFCIVKPNSSAIMFLSPTVYLVGSN